MTIQDILQGLPELNENRNYWLVRTNAGTYYDSFIEGGFIAVGWDLITLEDVSKGKSDDKTGFNILKNNIKTKYPSELRPGHTTNQLLKFSYKIKKNDIVLIPSINSNEISFGEVTETASFNNLDAKFDCPFIKRKSVKWLKTIKRHRLDPRLYKLMFSHQTISGANAYTEQIDKEINSFFVKGNKAHMVLGVQTHSQVKAKDLFQLGLLPMEIFDEFCKDENLDYHSDDFNVKLDVQSPGFIEISGLAIAGIVLLGIIMVAVAGGGFDFKYKKDLKVGVKTDGIIEKVRTFLKTKSNIKTKAQILEKHMKDLDIKDPKELIDILKELDK